MTDLLHEPVTNVGGLYIIQLTPVVGVLPAFRTDASITFREGFRWYTIYGTDQTRLYDERQSSTDNGPVWELTVSLFLPGDNADRRSQLADMVRHRFIVRCEDNNDQLRQVGSYEQPLELTYQFTTGKGVADLRGYALTFRGSLSEAPLIL